MAAVEWHLEAAEAVPTPKGDVMPARKPRASRRHVKGYLAHHDELRGSHGVVRSPGIDTLKFGVRRPR